MRTNIVIDENLLEEAFSVGQIEIKKNLVYEGLGEYVQLKRPKGLNEMSGKIDCSKGYDYKKLRKLRE